MSEHTPAPWNVKLNASFGDDGQPIVGTWIEAAEFNSLAIVMPAQNVQANARLIAAAPDLLEALKAVVDLSGIGHESPTCPEDDTCNCYVVGLVNAAIAKAEGR